MSTVKNVAVDLDGVLVDFVRGAFRHHGRSLPYNEVQWDFDKVLFPDDRAAFWEPLGYDFWSGLEWHPSGRALLAGIVERVGWDRITVLTSPCNTAGCADGKIDWIRRNIPELARSYNLGPDKGRIASTDLVLIDDAGHNVDSWRRRGPAVLVPQPWNAAWSADARIGDDYSVEYVLAQLENVL